MNRGLAGALVVALAVATGGVLLADELGRDESSVESTEPTSVATSAPTADATTAGTAPNGDEPASDETDGSAATTSSAGYDFTIEEVAKCGTTCRDVTARLANAGAQPRRNVRVTTRLYADGDLLWTGNETVGALAPGEAHTSTERVDVGFSGAMTIRDNDGYATIVTVVRSDSGTARFSERRQVA